MTPRAHANNPIANLAYSKGKLGLSEDGVHTNAEGKYKVGKIAASAVEELYKAKESRPASTSAVFQVGKQCRYLTDMNCQFLLT